MTAFATASARDRAAGLVARLCDCHGFSAVSAAGLAPFAAGGDNVLLLLEDPRRAPESFDLAVILPELLKSLPGRFHAGVADLDSSHEIAAAFGIGQLPALLFQRDGGYVGLIEGLLDWAQFQPAVAAMLRAPATRRPGIGIPVRAAGSCH